MTTTQIKRQQAKECFENYKGHNRLTVEEIQLNLNNINRFLKKELRFSKDLREIYTIESHFRLRHYYKALLSLIKNN